MAIKIVIWVARLLVGLLFIFSGFIKANDPLGFSYKLEEYFEKFASIFNEAGMGLLAHPMEWMAQIALPLAILIVVAEMILGVLTVLGVFMPKVTKWLLAMIIFFTFLTFVSWFFEIVKTCGCFGEVIPLTPFQSFIKDLILLVLIVVLFIFRKYINSIFRENGNKISFWSSAFVSFLFTWYCYQHLPVMDFGNYAPGKAILPQMETIPGNPLQMYKLKHKTKKIEVEFSDYPTDFNNWDYISTRPVSGDLTIVNIKVKATGQLTRIFEMPDEFEKEWEVIKTTDETFTPDIDPKIQQLSAFGYGKKEENYLDKMLSDTSYYFWLVIRDLEEFGNFQQMDQGMFFIPNPKGKGYFEKLNTFAKEANKNEVRFHVLCSDGSYEKVNAFRHALETPFNFFICDDTELKTMIRSSPGLLLLRKDTVIHKWHNNDFTNYQEISNQFIKR